VQRDTNISQKGTRLGNWLTREQAKELLAVRDRSTLKGKREESDRRDDSRAHRRYGTVSLRIDLLRHETSLWLQEMI
jgi:hypothetical protein